MHKSEFTQRMHAIRRIYYLSHKVKEQFLKTFVLPYFDFGLSLIPYFSQTAINKLAKAYYNAIYYILKIDCSGKTVDEINRLLEPHELMSFPRRIFNKIASFGFQMKYDSHAPEELKKEFDNCDRVPHSYDLRATTAKYLTPAATKNKTIHADRRFKDFYASLLNQHAGLRGLFIKYENEAPSRFTQCYAKFQASLSDTPSMLTTFTDIFPRFMGNYDLSRARYILNRPKMNLAHVVYENCCFIC